MDKNGLGLAARFRTVLDRVEVDEGRARAEREARLAEGRAAREALFDTLQGFADATGHLRATRDEDDALELSWRERTVRFEPMGYGERVRVVHDAAVQGEEEVRLYRVPDLANRWVLSVSRRGREMVSPFFDQGLEDLLVDGLGMPRPDRDEQVIAASRRQPPLDALVPRAEPRTEPAEEPSDEEDDGPRRTL